MTEYSNRSRWRFALITALLALGAGIIGYNVGLSHGAAAASAIQAMPPGPYPYWYGWHRPWGFGFGFPFLFFILLFLLFRGMCWGEPWRRRYYDEHERMKEGPPANDPGRG